MTKTSRTALFFSTALALGASSLSASAQPNGPGQGGMMGGGRAGVWGWEWADWWDRAAIGRLAGRGFRFPCSPSPKFVIRISKLSSSCF